MYHALQSFLRSPHMQRKLFNAVHKAQVSWKRIKPLMKHENYEDADNSVKCDSLEVKGLTFAYPGGFMIYSKM